VQTEFEREVTIDHQVEPTCRHGARIGSDCEHARIVAVKPQVIMPHLASGGRNHVGQVSRATVKKSL
jgi:hypothetical protein